MKCIHNVKYTYMHKYRAITETQLMANKVMRKRNSDIICKIIRAATRHTEKRRKEKLLK